MKKSGYLHRLPVFGAAIALTVLGMVAAIDGSNVEARSSTSGIQFPDADAGEPAPKDARPRRHRRGSLAMPYFSFAQSLRPRG
ncbi:hypothetical protein CSC70_07845 [Pseudoxanthomonas kalamensis DSM 18571]|uniref:hypothetical protein n=1 Tax=Pseudoxanthomonas kalamensis TaxID=289483 RepID=UPI0013915C82|nr:hypothetical protein [Pseudoxanthomonas kalamensis]KAF1710562.1 hypothetical protein CSC70_07845 [Pseudoxanthomonas kalamensis DSM 18571]